MKKLLDITITLLFFPVLLVIYPLILIVIYISDGSPGLYKQQRVGENGKAFLLYKFRTMDALSSDTVHQEHYEELSKKETIEPSLTPSKPIRIENDDRITNIGNFLRKTSLDELPNLINVCLLEEDQIKKIAISFKDKNSALFLGRGTMYAIAMEGALKLKEISYIHAEAYPAGELKHGPIALIDKKMPVIAVAPNDELLSKLKSNLQEVKSRGSQMIVFEDENSKVQAMEAMEVIQITSNLVRISAPIIFTIPLQ